MATSCNATAMLRDRPSKPSGDMRVALIVEATGGGVGRHVIDLAASLHERSVEVHLLYSARRIERGFEHGLSLLSSLGVTIREIDMRHNIHPSDVVAIRAVRRYLNANGPFDVIHCHSTKAGFVGRLSALGLGARTIYSPHEFVTMFPHLSSRYRYFAGRLERVLAHACDAVICVSEAERRHAQSLGFPDDLLHVVYNGIDVSEARSFATHRVSMRSVFGLQPNQLCIGFVGRLHPIKAPQMLLNAFAIATRNGLKDAHLVFVGSGPEADRLLQRSDQLRIADRVTLAGEMPGMEAMAAFDIMAISSLSESFPYVLLESMALGLPIVSTDVGGIRELVQSGRNGFLVKSGGVEEMATALEQLLSSPRLRESLALESTIIVQEFTKRKMGDGILQVYEPGRRS